MLDLLKVQKGDLRTAVRQILLWILGSVVVAIFVALVAEFFIKLLEEWGWYTNPSQRMGRAMSVVGSFLVSSWFLLPATFLVGLTAGVWLDWVLRRLSEQETTKTAATRQRELSKERQEMFAEDLKERGIDADKLEVRYASGCVECKEFAGKLAEALIWAGWNGATDTSLDERPELTGLRPCLEDMDAKPRNANLLAGALRRANIDFEWWPMPGLQDRLSLWVYPEK